MSAETATSTSSAGDTRRAPSVEAASVCVVAGGRSSERAVSLASGGEILRALSRPGGAARTSAVEIDGDGRWSLPDASGLAPAAALARLDDVDLFFLALHGGDGEDGTIQGLFESLGRAYTGSGVGGSALAMDKVVARDLVAKRGIRVARASELSREFVRREGDAALAELARWSVPGWVAKPRRGGSSVGTAIARTADELEATLARALAVEDEVLVEELVPGTELTVGVVTDPSGAVRALTPIEIRPHAGRFFDYDEKYRADGALELCPPSMLDAAGCARLAGVALRAHAILGCEGYSRSDFILPFGEEEAVFLELNTLPGMTARSLLPLAARHDGIDFPTLCAWIAADGLRRGAPRRPPGSPPAGT